MKIKTEYYIAALIGVSVALYKAGKRAGIFECMLQTLNNHPEVNSVEYKFSDGRSMRLWRPEESTQEKVEES